VELLWIVLAIAVAAVLGLVPALIARGKGRSFVSWWLFGALTWIIAMIAVLLVEDKAAAARHGLTSSAARTSIDSR
jgi:hypothetical protein